MHPRYEGGFFVTVPTPDAERKAELLRQRGIYLIPLAAGALRIALCSVATRDVPRLARSIADVVHG